MPPKKERKSMSVKDHEAAGKKLNAALKAVSEIEEVCLQGYPQIHKIPRAATTARSKLESLCRHLDDEWFMAARSEGREGAELINAVSPYFPEKKEAAAKEPPADAKATKAGK